MNLINKVLIGAVAALLLFLTIASSVSAYTVTYPGTYSTAYAEYYPSSPNYYYYGGYDGIPTVAGPYPRYYIGYNDYRGTAYDAYKYDDFNHFDEYIGYRDLDVRYPSRGYVDVLRNPTGDITTDLLDPDWRVYDSAEEYHVSGVLPGGALYTKHYYHDHPWDLGGEYWGYGWFQPIVSYIKKPVFKHSCFSQSICQYNYCSCN